MSSALPPTIPSLTPSNAFENSKWAIVSLVCGAFAILGGACVFGLLFGVAGIVAGVAHLRNQSVSRGLAKFGLGLSTFGLVLSIGFLVVYIQLGSRWSERHPLRPAVTGAPGTGLAKSDVPWEFEEVWEITLDSISKDDNSISTMAIGDVVGDVAPEILIVTCAFESEKFNCHVLDANGREISVIPLPQRAWFLETGQGPEGPRLLIGDALNDECDSIMMINLAGEVLWSHTFNESIDDRRLGDIDGDGLSEVLVGLDGGGGLHLFDIGGKKLWSDTTREEYWSQAILDTALDEQAVVLSSTDDGEVVRYGPDGSKVGTIQPRGEYIADFAVRRSGPGGKLQFISEGGSMDNETALVFDERGAIAWETPVDDNWLLNTAREYAYGKLRGEAEGEWVFMLDEHRFVAVSESGTWIATLSLEMQENKVSMELGDGTFEEVDFSNPDVLSFVVLPVLGEQELLVLQGTREVRAYRLKRAATEQMSHEN